MFMSSKKKVIIVGAGPGGLSSAMLLASRGFDVNVYEKASQPGGRTSEINLKGFRFDVGPTFFMMKYILDEIFEQSGLKSDNYLDFLRLSPMYRLIYPDNGHIDIFDDADAMKAELKRVFPGEENGLDKFNIKEKKRFAKLMPLLQGDNNNIFDAFKWRTISSLPYFSFGKSLYQVMGNYFRSPLARLSFTFQAKYLGMSPWECPGAFGLVPFVEHDQGVYHVKGGLSEITRQMARAAQELGAKIHYNSSVRQVLLDDGKVVGVELDAGEKISADKVVINADFGYACNNLFPAGALKKYSRKQLDKKGISCSIFLMLLGLKKQYRLEHNTIVFAKDYKKNVEEVFSGKLSGDNISFYVRDTSVTDPNLAPKGKSAMYVLLPVPNNRAGIDWNEQRSATRRYLLDALKERLGLDDLEENIELEQIITPEDWEKNYNVYEGATFNLAHNLGQMMWFRPHNEFEEVGNCYLTGGGTHPGSGLPTIFESGRICAKLICKKYGVRF